MDSIAAAASLRSGLKSGCADDIVEALCNLSDGTCDAVELIPVLEQVAQRNHFRFLDDNGAGGAPHGSGKPRSFRGWARAAIKNITENQQLPSGSRMAGLLKSSDTDVVKSALDELMRDNWADSTLIPILEKIARKDNYDSYSCYGWEGPIRLGEAARRAIQRIRDNSRS